MLLPIVVLPNVATDSCFNNLLIRRQLTDLYLKWKMSTKMESSLIAIKEMILRAALSLSAETHCRFSQTPKIKLFVRMDNDFN